MRDSRTGGQHADWRRRALRRNHGPLEVIAAFGKAFISSRYVAIVWLVLPVIGVIFVMEALSDVIQVGYFKLSGGKRVFRRAPIHNHFEMGGWAETQVVTRFWLIGFAGAMLGVAMALAVPA